MLLNSQRVGVNVAIMATARVRIMEQNRSGKAHSLSRLVELAKTVKMSEAQKVQQRNSFVYGNTKIENDKVTLELVESIAKTMEMPSH